MEELILLLNEMNIPYAYDHFAEGESPAPPFITYLLPDSSNFSADGKVYMHFSEVRVELYTDKKDIASEDKIRNVLDLHGYFYRQTEVFIESEKLYETTFTFTLKGR